MRTKIIEHNGEELIVIINDKGETIECFFHDILIADPDYLWELITRMMQIQQQIEIEQIKARNRFWWKLYGTKK